jgi:hypothetical protein
MSKRLSDPTVETFFFREANNNKKNSSNRVLKRAKDTKGPEGEHGKEQEKRLENELETFT